MEDERTPTTSWLALSLAYPSGTRLCHHLRQSIPEPARLGSLIRRHLDHGDTDLIQALAACPGNPDPALLRSNATRKKIDEALCWCANAETHHLIGLDHPAYPALLQGTSDSPPLLYAKGSLDALTRPLVAIVGSRKASLLALKHTRELAAQLAERGVGIVSGLALGIDAAAHEGALDAGGTTIAVAATEPDVVYPKRHRSLARRIMDSNGVILTEYPIGTPTLRWFFPQRNRIISGISMGVIVMEASLPSGTLTTAKHAMEQGREVMAVPGSIHHLQARGCHALIKQGAALIEKIDDVLDVLGQPLQRQLARLDALTARPSGTSGTLCAPTQSVDTLQPDQTLTDNDITLLNCLNQQAATLDELMTLTTLSVPELSSALGMLEIRGLIRTTSGGRYARC